MIRAQLEKIFPPAGQFVYGHCVKAVPGNEFAMLRVGGLLQERLLKEKRFPRGKLLMV